MSELPNDGMFKLDESDQSEQPEEHRTPPMPDPVLEKRMSGTPNSNRLTEQELRPQLSKPGLAEVLESQEAATSVRYAPEVDTQEEKASFLVQTDAHCPVSLAARKTTSWDEECLACSSEDSATFCNDGARPVLPDGERLTPQDFRLFPGRLTALYERIIPLKSGDETLALKDDEIPPVRIHRESVTAQNPLLPSQGKTRSFEDGRIVPFRPQAPHVQGRPSNSYLKTRSPESDTNVSGISNEGLATQDDSSQSLSRTERLMLNDMLLSQPHTWIMKSPGNTPPLQSYTEYLIAQEYTNVLLKSAVEKLTDSATLMSAPEPLDKHATVSWPSPSSAKPPSPKTIEASPSPSVLEAVITSWSSKADTVHRASSTRLHEEADQAGSRSKLGPTSLKGPPARDDIGRPVFRPLEDCSVTSAGQLESGMAGQDGEGGWGWVVCATAMLTNGTVTGFLNALSIVYVAILERFGDEANDPNLAFKSSWITTSVLIMTFFMSSVAGILSDRFGIRKVAFSGGLLAFAGTVGSAFVDRLGLLYLTFGVGVGTGFAFCLSQSMVVVCHYFRRRVGLVFSLMAFTGGLFSVLFSLALPALFATLGFRDTLLALSALNALLMLYALSWRERRPGSESVQRPAAGSCSRHPDDSTCSAPSGSWRSSVSDVGSCSSGPQGPGRGRGGLLNRRIWRNGSYVVWALGSTVGMLGFSVGSFHMVKFSIDRFSASDAKLLPLGYGAAMGVSRLLFGVIADRDVIKKMYFRLQPGILIVIGVVTICLPDVHSFPHLLLGAVLIGICDGVFFLLIGPVALTLVGVADSSQAVGFFFTCIAIPLALGPSLAGFLYDRYGGYTLAFRLLGVPCIAGGLLMLLVPLASTRSRQKGRSKLYAAPRELEFSPPPTRLSSPRMLRPASVAS